MKSKLMIFAFLAVVFLPAVSLANVTACDTAGAAPIVLDSELLSGSNTDTITDSLADYRTAGVLIDGVYYLNFDSGGRSIYVGEDFELVVPEDEDKDIYICNLNIRRWRATDLPFITIYNSGARNIYIDGLTLGDVRHGLKLVKTGMGNFYVTNTVIAGNAEKSGYCLFVEAADTTITGGEFRTCANGIRIVKDNVSVRSASIDANKIGVYVDAGVSGMKITDSLIFGNYSVEHPTVRRLDGIFYADQPFRDLKFCSVRDNCGVDIPLMNLSHGPWLIYIQLPDISTSGVIELFDNIRNFPCENQACSKLAAYEIGPDNFIAEGVIALSIPLMKWLSGVTAIYTHPIIGSTVISRPSPYGETAPPAAFITAPYDIPTPGVAPGGSTGSEGNAGDDADDSNTNPTNFDNSMSGESGNNPPKIAPLPESGDIQPAPGSVPITAGCSLTTAGPDMRLNLDLLYLTLAAIVIAGLRKKLSKLPH